MPAVSNEVDWDSPVRVRKPFVFQACFVPVMEGAARSRSTDTHTLRLPALLKQCARPNTYFWTRFRISNARSLQDALSSANEHLTRHCVIEHLPCTCTGTSWHPSDSGSGRAGPHCEAVPSCSEPRSRNGSAQKCSLKCIACVSLKSACCRVNFKRERAGDE